MGRRGYDDEDDDDDLDIGSRLHEREGGQPLNALAITSMIMGIAAIVIYLGGFLCVCIFPPFAFLPWGLALLLALVSIILGFIGNTPGSQGFAWTGIICSTVTVLLFILSIAIALLFGIALFAGGGGF